MLEEQGCTKNEESNMSMALAPVDDAEQQWLIAKASSSSPLIAAAAESIVNGVHKAADKDAADKERAMDEISTTVAFCSYNADSRTVMSNSGNASAAKTVRSTKTYNVSSRMTSTRQTSRQLVLNTTKDIHAMNLEDLTEQLEDADKRQAAVRAAVTPTVEERFFEQLLNLEKERFSDLFPQLRCVRVKTTPTETSVRITRNADGTITRIQTTQSRSVIRCSRMTKMDGSKTDQVTTALVEYHGPEGKLRVKLDDGGASGVQSESDEDEEPMDSSFLTKLFGKAYRKRSSATLALSAEATREQLVALTPPDHEAIKRKRQNRAFYAAEELVQTEQRYVEKLDLLNEVFRKKIEEANANGRLMAPAKFAVLFSNFNSIHAFHKRHFLPELQNRLANWQSVTKISDIVCQQAPFLKLYSDYINNYKRAVKTFEEMCRKSGKFSSIVSDIERMPECENLPLTSHIIAPVQRVMRYHLLMQEYLKSLEDDHPDKEDTERALELVRGAASHANEVMRKMDQYRDLVELQEQLGSQVPDLVSPKREIVKQGRLNKLSSKSDESQSRHIFLFNDMLLVCSERVMAITKYKVRALLRLSNMLVLEGDRLDVDYSFYVRTDARAIELCAKTFKDKSDWMESLWRAIDQNETARNNLSVTSAANQQTFKETTTRNCSLCLGVFGVFRRDYVCQQCKAVVCKKCCRRKMSCRDGDEKVGRLCQTCFSKINKRASNETDGYGAAESNMQVVTASNTMLEGWMQFRPGGKKAWTKAYFRLNKDFVLCRFANNKEKVAKAYLPLPGVNVGLPEGDHGALCTEYLVEHKNRTYFFRCSNQEETAKWMALLDLSSRAQIPKSTMP